MPRLRIDRLASATAVLRGPRGAVLVRCHVARGFAARTVGLLGTASLDEGEGVWLEPCGSVHTWFLRAPIGVAFLDGDGVVVKVTDPLPRWRMAGARGARVAVEAPAGALSGLAVGQRLVLSDPA